MASPWLPHPLLSGDLGQWEATARDERVEGENSWHISSPVLAVIVCCDCRPDSPPPQLQLSSRSRAPSAPQA